jgi:hypothetical protein
MKWLERLIDEGGIKHYIKKWLYCRKGHDWRDAGDWFICANCDELQRIVNE